MPIWCNVMKRVCGFALFFVAVGMILLLLIANEMIGILLICACLVIGYNLFCC